MTTTFSWCSARNPATLMQNSGIMRSGGGLWSSNGKSFTRELNLAGSYERSEHRLYTM